MLCDERVFEMGLRIVAQERDDVVELSVLSGSVCAFVAFFIIWILTVAIWILSAFFVLEMMRLGFMDGLVWAVGFALLSTVLVVLGAMFMVSLLFNRRIVVDFQLGTCHVAHVPGLSQTVRISDIRCVSVVEWNYKSNRTFQVSIERLSRSRKVTVARTACRLPEQQSLRKQVDNFAGYLANALGTRVYRPLRSGQLTWWLCDRRMLDSHSDRDGNRIRMY